MCKAADRRAKRAAETVQVNAEPVAPSSPTPPLSGSPQGKPSKPSTSPSGATLEPHPLDLSGAPASRMKLDPSAPIAAQKSNLERAAERRAADILESIKKAHASLSLDRCIAESGTPEMVEFIAQAGACPVCQRPYRDPLAPGRGPSRAAGLFDYDQESRPGSRFARLMISGNVETGDGNVFLGRFL